MNPATLVAKACAMPARLHNATPNAKPSRNPTRSMNQPVPRNATAVANWKAVPMLA